MSHLSKRRLPSVRMNDGVRIMDRSILPMRIDFTSFLSIKLILLNGITSKSTVLKKFQRP
jgi:hypothetical protein